LRGVLSPYGVDDGVLRASPVRLVNLLLGARGPFSDADLGGWTLDRSISDFESPRYPPLELLNSLSYEVSPGVTEPLLLVIELDSSSPEVEIALVVCVLWSIWKCTAPHFFERKTS
jgi:hypothetical protein